MPGKVGRPRKKATKKTTSAGTTETKTSGRKTNAPREWVCTCCGTKYADHEKNFFVSYSPLYAENERRLPICKSCIRKQYENYVEILGDEREAVKRVCMKLDLYYSDDIFNSIKTTSVDTSRMLVYMRNLSLVQNKDKTYDDTIKEQTKMIINTINDIEEVNESSTNIYQVTEDDLVRWGPGFLPEDYFWMNEAYDKLKATNIIDTAMKETLIKDYCKHTLFENKAINQGKIDQYLKFSDAAQKTLDRANLTPKLEDANDKAGEKPMGVMIQMFEKERPIPKPNPEWKDVDGIVRFITIYFIGHLCKMLGLKNNYAYLYEEEMNKYRANLPYVDEDEDDTVFDALLSGKIKFAENTPEGRGDV